MPSSSDRPPEPPDESAPDDSTDLSGSNDPSQPIGPEDGIHESSGVYESDDGIYDEDPEDTAGGAWRLSRLNMGLLCLSVVSLSAALYISPAGSDVRQKVEEALPGGTVGRAVTDPGMTSSATPSSTATGAATPDASVALAAERLFDKVGSSTPTRAGTSGASTYGGGSGISGVSALSPSRTGGYQSAGSGAPTLYGPPSTPTPRPPAAIPTTPSPSTPPTPSPSARPTPSPPTPTPSTPAPSAAAEQLTKCYQFTWQQDAQRVYLLNLSDPYGLDADPGPHDGDGLACSELPVDATRAASPPVAAYAPPKPGVATKRALVTPDQDYFGFLQDGLPGDTAAIAGLAARAGKAPSTTGWFASFDTPYRADLVRKAWTHGSLPVVTWMPTDEGSGTSYSLSTIIDGTHDRYLRRFAGDVVREGLPVSLRFGHEMNGSWYGWSAGRADFNNTPAKYVAAWRHIWQVFDDVGATDEVIWLWSPGRVDNLRPSATNGLTAMAEDYPGDAYVDWVGASVYLRTSSTGPSYAASFAKTVTALEAVTDKPIFFAETAAAQSDLGVDRTDLKVAWMENVIGHFASDRRVVGFLWFNNVAATVINGVEVTNDWRFDATETTRDAFRRVIDSPTFAEGVPLD